MKSAENAVKAALEAKLTQCKVSSSQRTDRGSGRKFLFLKAEFEIECEGKKASRKIEWKSENGERWVVSSRPDEVIRTLKFLVYGSSNVNPNKRRSFPHVNWMAREIYKQIWAKAKRHSRTRKVQEMGSERKRSEERKNMLSELQVQMNRLFGLYGGVLRKQDVVQAYDFAVRREKVRQVMED